MGGKGNAEEEKKDLGEEKKGTESRGKNLKSVHSTTSGKRYGTIGIEGKIKNIFGG